MVIIYNIIYYQETLSNLLVPEQNGCIVFVQFYFSTCKFFHLPPLALTYYKWYSIACMWARFEMSNIMLAEDCCRRVATNLDFVLAKC